MKYIVVEPFTLETSQGTLVIEAGKILELTPDQAKRLGRKVEPFDESNGRELAHFCAKAVGWCSAKLPGGNYPADCERIQCSSHHGENEWKR